MFAKIPFRELVAGFFLVLFCGFGIIDFHHFQHDDATDDVACEQCILVHAQNTGWDAPPQTLTIATYFPIPEDVIAHGFALPYTSLFNKIGFPNRPPPSLS
jgi:hypothetical protein